MTIDESTLLGDITGVLERPGVRLVYEMTGEGPAVVLIHGFGLDMRMWDPQAGPLAARFRVVRYDCRGFRRLRAVRPRRPLYPRRRPRRAP